MDPSGRLIGSGRSADIFEHGEDRVLRRSRSHPVPMAETIVMNAVARAGFPVPEVFAVDGCDMVMERIVGVDLLTHLSKRPWQARRVGIMLAQLHVQLAAIPLLENELPTRIGPRESYVHGDLHPGNVLLSPNGPVVIDWEGAGVGARDVDVATTWLLLETAEADDVPRLIRPFVGLVRGMVVKAFLKRVDRPSIKTIAEVCALRITNPNTRTREAEAIRVFLAKQNGVST